MRHLDEAYCGQHGSNDRRWCPRHEDADHCHQQVRLREIGQDEARALIPAERTHWTEAIERLKARYVHDDA